MTIRFGVDAAHLDYVIPVAIIYLYDAKGASNYQTLCLRMGGQFSTAIRAAYDDAQGIMGTPFGPDQAVISKLGSVGANFLSGVQSQIVKAGLGATGMIASGGQSGRQQVEFLSRVFISNFQQVVYRGPSFRLFTLPFVMKPTSKVEAQNMKVIISYLKRASVPKLGATNIVDAVADIFGNNNTNIFAGTLASTDRQVALEALLKDKSENQINEDKTLQNARTELERLRTESADFVQQEDIEGYNFAPESPLTFGYPDICIFELALYQPSQNILKKIFKSKACVFESVVADYGSSNKMTFFEDGYYPTEVGLTLNLKELEFETTKSVYEYTTNSENYTII
jgi:hypothetical protein